MSSGGKETPQKKYFVSTQKRFQSPLTNRRTWDVPDARKVSSPFRQPTPLRVVSQPRSPAENGSERNTPDKNGSINGNAQLNAEDDLLTWMKSIKEKAINILKTEKLEEERFYHELEREKSILEKQYDINTESFDILQSYLNKESKPHPQYEEDQCTSEDASQVEEIQSGEERYEESEDEFVIPEDANVIDISEDDEEEEEEEAHYDPSLFVDQTTKYKPTTQTRSMYLSVNPFGSNIKHETNYYQTSDGDEGELSYVEDEEAQSELESVEEQWSSDHDIEEILHDGSYDENEYEPQSEQENMNDDMNNFDVLASAALLQSQDQLSPEEVSYQSDAQPEEYGDHSQEESDDELVEHEQVESEEEYVQGSEEEHELVNSEVEDYQQGESEEEHQQIESGLEELEYEVRDEAESANESEEELKEPLNHDIEQPLSENEHEPADDIDKQEQAAEVEVEEKFNEVPEPEVHEEVQATKEAYVEEQYFDSDNEPFEDPATSMFGQLSPGGLINTLDEDDEGFTPNTNVNILQDVPILAHDEPENLEEYQQMIDGNTLDKTTEIEQKPESDQIKENENEGEEHESFVSFFDSRVLSYSPKSAISFAQVSNEFLKTTVPARASPLVNSINANPIEDKEERLLTSSEKQYILDDLNKEEDEDDSEEKTNSLSQAKETLETVAGELFQASTGGFPENVVEELVDNIPNVNAALKDALHVPGDIANKVLEESLGETGEKFVGDLVDNIEVVEEENQGSTFDNLIIEQVEVTDYVYPEDQVYPVDEQQEEQYEDNDLEMEDYDQEMEGYDNYDNGSYFNNDVQKYPLVPDENFYNEPEEAVKVDSASNVTTSAESPAVSEQTVDKTPKRRAGFFGFLNAITKFVSAATIDPIEQPTPEPPQREAHSPSYQVKDTEMDFSTPYDSSKEDLNYSDAIIEFVEETANISHVDEMTVEESDLPESQTDNQTPTEQGFNFADAVNQFVEETANVPHADETTVQESNETEPQDDFQTSVEQPSQGLNFADAVTQFVEETANIPHADETTINETAFAETPVETPQTGYGFADALNQFVEETANIPHADEITVQENDDTSSDNEVPVKTDAPTETLVTGSDFIDAVNQFVEETANVPHADETTVNETLAFGESIVEDISEAVVEFAEPDMADVFEESTKDDISQIVESPTKTSTEVMSDLVDAIDEFVEETANIPLVDEQDMIEEPEMAEKLEISEEPEKLEEPKEMEEPHVFEGSRSPIDEIFEAFDDFEYNADNYDKNQKDVENPKDAEDSPIRVERKPQLRDVSALRELLFSNDSSELSLLPDDTMIEEPQQKKIGTVNEENILEPIKIQDIEPIFRRSKRVHDQITEFEDPTEEVASSEPIASATTSPRKRRQLKPVMDHNHIIMKTRSGKILGAQTDEEIKAAEIAESKETELLENIAHGDTGNKALKTLITDYEFIDQLDHHLKDSKQNVDEEMVGEQEEFNEVVKDKNIKPDLVPEADIKEQLLSSPTKRTRSHYKKLTEVNQETSTRSFNGNEDHVPEYAPVIASPVKKTSSPIKKNTSPRKRQSKRSKTETLPQTSFDLASLQEPEPEPEIKSKPSRRTKTTPAEEQLTEEKPTSQRGRKQTKNEQSDTTKKGIKKRGKKSTKDETSEPITETVEPFVETTEAQGPEPPVEKSEDIQTTEPTQSSEQEPAEPTEEIRVSKRGRVIKQKPQPRD